MRSLVTSEEMARIDAEAQEMGIPGMVLMENAGQHAFRIWLAAAIEEGFGPAFGASVEAAPGGAAPGGATGTTAPGTAATMAPGTAGTAAPDRESVFRAGGIARGLLPSGAARLLGPVVAVAGAGNNGGDALVIARAAWNLGIPVSAVLSRRELKGSAEEQRRVLLNMGVPIYAWGDPQGAEAIRDARWIFDGVAGTGISGALRGVPMELVAAMNESAGEVVAVDVPSGLGDAYEPGFPAVRAKMTVTMGLLKRSLYHPRAREFAGQIFLGEPGFPRSLLERPVDNKLAEVEDLQELLPAVSGSAHKGRRGFVGLFAGSEGTAGAAALAALGALRVGSGLVRVHTDPAIRAEVAAADPALMVAPFDSAVSDGEPAALSELIGRYTALCVGPGWGVGEQRYRLLDALRGAGIPGVLDADGLNTLAAYGGFSDLSSSPAAGGGFRGWVFTPHPGEAARLLGIPIREVLSAPVEAATRISKSYGATVLLKGAVSLVVRGTGEAWFVDGGEPALATAGSGDVLSGVIAGLLAGGGSPLKAALGGAILHREAGRRLAREEGWFTASRLPAAVAPVSAAVRRR